MRQIPFILLLVLLSITGCAKKVHFDLMTPAKTPLKNVKDIAILPFHTRQYHQISAKEKRYIPQKEECADIFQQAFIENGFYRVLEREALQHIMEEQELSATGAVSDTDMVESGKLLGVDALLMGTLTTTVSDSHVTTLEKDWRRSYNDSTGFIDSITPVEITNHQTVRNIDGTLTYKIVDTETGTILKSASYQIKERMTSSKESSREKSINMTPPWQPSISHYIKQIADQLLKEIAPHKQKHSRSFEKGESAEMKKAYNYATHTILTEAKKIWKKVYRTEGFGNKKDFADATANLGILYELEGDMEKARLYYTKAFDISQKKRFLKMAQRSSKLHGEQQNLKTQYQ